MPDSTLQRRAPAKLNLGLHVLRLRADGYRDIETVFLPIAWYDTLTAAPSTSLTLTCSDPDLPTDRRNLVLRAALRLHEHLGGRHGAAVHLDKHLPYGAGLGGGSSDAAHTLRLLEDLWDARVPRGVLEDIAVGLGSDVAFFLDDEPAYATGRGERLSTLPDGGSGSYRCPFALVVAAPHVHVDTGRAYDLVTPRARGRADLRSVVRSNDLERWRRELVNDFEAPICAEHPQLLHVRQALLDAGAGYAAMSGSGSAFWGAFESESAARAAAAALAQQGYRTWSGYQAPL
jgi:4-diphosphocytidyl-2-C-methyl-D-erythritol kinase